MGLLLSYRFTLALDMTDALYQRFVLLGPAFAESDTADCRREGCLAPFPVESGFLRQTGAGKGGEIGRCDARRFTQPPLLDLVAPVIKGSGQLLAQQAAAEGLGAPPVILAVLAVGGGDR